GQRNRIRCLLRLPSTTRGQAGPSDGAVEMTSTPCRRRHFSRRSIFLGHGSMSIQSSHATNSTSSVGECDLYSGVLSAVRKMILLLPVVLCQSEAAPRTSCRRGQNLR